MVAVHDVEAVDHEAGALLAGLVRVGRGGGDGARAEAGHGRDHLEDRTWRVQPLGGPIKQGRGVAGRRQAGQVGRAIARRHDLVGIERGRAGQGEHAPGRRVQGHDGALLLAQQLHRVGLQAHVQRRHHVERGRRGGPELAQQLVDRGGAGQAREVGVVRVLEPGGPQGRAPVAHDGLGGRLRVAAHAHAPDGHVLGQDRAARVQDPATRAVPQGRHERVARIVRQGLGLQTLPVPQAEGHRGVADDDGDGEAGQAVLHEGGGAAVHRTARSRRPAAPRPLARHRSPRVRTAGGAGASTPASLRAISSPTQMPLPRSDEPP